MLVEIQSGSPPRLHFGVLSPNQQDALVKEKENQQQKDIRQAAFVEFDTPRDFLFEGETTPVTISLFLMNGLPVTRLPPPPNKIGDSFSHDRDSPAGHQTKLLEKRKVIHGLFMACRIDRRNGRKSQIRFRSHHPSSCKKQQEFAFQLSLFQRPLHRFRTGTIFGGNK